MAAYQKRRYRVHCGRRGLTAFTVRVKETDLWILAQRDLSRQALESVLNHRRSLETYLSQRPGFLESLTPLPPDPLAPPLVRAMLQAGQTAGTGPMAAVAGAMAQAVGEELRELSPQVVVENGGDLFLAADRELTVGLWAGDSPLSGRLGIRVAGERMPTCLACSSGTVGHSLSLGRADAAVVAARDGALADAAATALGNRVSRRDHLAPALEWVSSLPGVEGALVVLGDRLGAWGEMTLVELEQGDRA